MSCHVLTPAVCLGIMVCTAVGSWGWSGVVTPHFAVMPLGTFRFAASQAESVLGSSAGVTQPFGCHSFISKIPSVDTAADRKLLLLAQLRSIEG